MDYDCKKIVPREIQEKNHRALDMEAANDEAAIEFGIRIGRLGNIRTTTLKAFTEEEIARVVDKLG
jgi:uncharacterized protein with GYD domain